MIVNYPVKRRPKNNRKLTRCRVFGGWNGYSGGYPQQFKRELEKRLKSLKGAKAAKKQKLSIPSQSHSAQYCIDMVLEPEIERIETLLNQ